MLLSCYSDRVSHTAEPYSESSFLLPFGLRMARESPSDHEPEDYELDFVEIDPTRRYGRVCIQYPFSVFYLFTISLFVSSHGIFVVVVLISLISHILKYKEVLGKGAFKRVYNGFDEWEGIEVAWNQVKVPDLVTNSVDLERLYSEVHLLKTLKHKNIIKFYNSWVDTKNGNINFITEIFTSGTLRQYRKKHKRVESRALKNWSRQILEGLFYLHSHDPPIIHRDVKCDNIFVNGNQGEVKIGDLGLAAILQKAPSAHSVIGTPEFMAPELYEEEYNELVDIYAFGMCLLELTTFEYPYVECANAAQIYKKVTSGIKPASLAKVTDPAIKEFIEKCLAKVSDRLTAKELLMDPFLRQSESIGRSSRPEMLDSADSFKETIVNESAMDSSAELAEPSSGFCIEGQRKDINTVFLKLRIADSKGQHHNIHFPFNIEVDTALAVASEMVEELDVTDQDVSTIANIIESEVHSYIPDWCPHEFSENSLDRELEGSEPSEMEDDVFPSLSSSCPPSPHTLRLERLPSGRKYWSDSPKLAGGSSPSKPGTSNFYSHDTSLDHWVAGDNPNTSSSPDKANGNSRFDDDNCNDEGSSSCNEVQTCGGESVPPSDSKEDGLRIYFKKIGDTESGGKAIVEKLETLLAQQQEELDELKRKHKLAISSLLNELLPEIREKILDEFQISGHEL